MTMLLLKRLNVPLDRDVIFLAEAGEEGTTRVGIELHGRRSTTPRSTRSTAWPKAATSRRSAAQVKFATVQTLEKIPRAVELTRAASPGTARCRSAQCDRASGARRSRASGRGAADPAERDDAALLQAARRDLAAGRSGTLSRRAHAGRQGAAAADDVLSATRAAARVDAAHVGLAHIFNGGYRINVIPSEAKATLDVRMLPDEDPEHSWRQMQKVINDPAVEVEFRRRRRPGGARRGSTPRRSRRSRRGRRKHYERSRCRR